MRGNIVPVFRNNSIGQTPTADPVRDRPVYFLASAAGSHGGRGTSGTFIRIPTRQALLTPFGGRRLYVGRAEGIIGQVPHKELLRCRCSSAPLLL